VEAEDVSKPGYQHGGQNDDKIDPRVGIEGRTHHRRGQNAQIHALKEQRKHRAGGAEALHCPVHKGTGEDAEREEYIQRIGAKAHHKAPPQAVCFPFSSGADTVLGTHLPHGGVEQKEIEQHRENAGPQPQRGIFGSAAGKRQRNAEQRNGKLIQKQSEDIVGIILKKLFHTKTDLSVTSFLL